MELLEACNPHKGRNAIRAGGTEGVHFLRKSKQHSPQSWLYSGDRPDCVVGCQSAMQRRRVITGLGTWETGRRYQSVKAWVFIHCPFLCHLIRCCKPSKSCHHKITREHRNSNVFAAPSAHCNSSSTCERRSFAFQALSYNNINNCHSSTARQGTCNSAKYIRQPGTQVCLRGGNKISKSI